MKTKAILEIIKTGISSVEMDSNNDEWRTVVPPLPGWYFIQTNTPPQAFKNVGPPKGHRHYDIPRKASQSLVLNEYDACILPSGNSFYFVYSGVRGILPSLRSGRMRRRRGQVFILDKQRKSSRLRRWFGSRPGYCALERTDKNGGGE